MTKTKKPKQIHHGGKLFAGKATDQEVAEKARKSPVTYLFLDYE